MGALFEHLLNVVLPIALCVGLGGVLAWSNMPFDNKVIGKLVQMVGYPALILSHLGAGHVNVGDFLTMLGAAVAMVVVFFCLGILVLRVLGKPVRFFLAPMSLNNTGNIGLPVAALAFGSVGMSYGLAFVVAVLLGVFTIGSWLPKGSVSFRELVTSPVLYAIVVALALLATGAKLPVPLARATDILGGLAVPLMLLTLGHSLATLNVGDLRQGALLALVHLAMGLVIGFGLVALFGFTGTERGVLVVLAVMPPSVATYLFVEMYAPEHAPEVAGLILVSTLLSVIVLPVLLAFGV